MRLLLLSPGFPIGPGHFTPGITDTLYALSARHDIEVLSVCAPPPQGRYTQRGLTVYSAGQGPRLLRLRYLIQTARTLHKRAPFDLVWAIWPDRTGPLANLIGRIVHCPVVHSLMGGELAALPELDYGASRSAASALKIRATLAGGALVTAGSKKLLATLRGLLPGVPAACCPLGVRVDAIVPRPPGPFKNPVELLMVSDLSKVKRIELAVDTLARLNTQQNTRLSIFGASRKRADTVEQRAYQLRLKDAVYLQGFIEPELMRARFAQHDLMLHTSAHESQGMALIEAASADLPIVCVDVGVARELQTLGAAVIIAKDTPEHLAKAVLGACSAPRPTPKARLATFGVEACAARFEAHFARLSARS